MTFNRRGFLKGLAVMASTQFMPTPRLPATMEAPPPPEDAMMGLLMQNRPFPSQFEIALLRKGKETAYPGYRRQVLNRTRDDWEVTANEDECSAWNVKAVVFPERVDWGGECIVDGFAVLVPEGKPIVVGRLDRPIIIEHGVTPMFSPGELKIEMGHY